MITTLRFPTTRSLDRIAAACGLVGAVYAQDAAGHYIASYSDAHPLFLALPERTVRTAASPVQARKVPTAKKEGACARIQSWCRANPEATREGALAHFANLNPSTVKVQFGKARRA